MHFGKVTLLSENNGFEEIQKQRGGEIEGFMIQTIQIDSLSGNCFLMFDDLS